MFLWIACPSLPQFGFEIQGNLYESGDYSLYLFGTNAIVNLAPDHQDLVALLENGVVKMLYRSLEEWHGTLEYTWSLPPMTLFFESDPVHTCSSPKHITNINPFVSKQVRDSSMVTGHLNPLGCYPRLPSMIRAN